MMKPPNALKRYLEEKCMSQAELAKKAKITPQAIHYYVTGKRVPTRGMALKLSAETGIPVLDLLYSPKELRAK